MNDLGGCFPHPIAVLNTIFLFPSVDDRKHSLLGGEPNRDEMMQAISRVSYVCMWRSVQFSSLRLRFPFPQ